MKKFGPCLLCLIFTVGGSLCAADGLRVSEGGTKQALHAVINAQLAAFRKDDYAVAYIYADSGFRDEIPLPFFERMVRSGYPAIAHSTSARCGLSMDNGDEAVVNVRVFSERSEPIDYQYTLRRDGVDWRITSVTLLKEIATES